MSSNTTPIVLSSYDASGQYFGYVSVALDRQRIAIEPVQKSGNLSTIVGADNNYFLLDDSSHNVSTLEWYYSSSADAQCIALGLNIGEIWIYSPLANDVIHKFSTGNSRAIKDIKVQGNSLWCIDADDVFYEFDIENFQLTQHFKVENCFQLNKLCLLPKDSKKLLVASHSIYLVDISKKEIILTFPGHVLPVTILKLLSSDFFLSGAHNDRFLNVYDLNTGLAKSILVAQSNVLELSHIGQDNIAITTEDGMVELFIDPLVNNKIKRRAAKSKQSNKQIRFKADREIPTPVINVFINQDILNVTLVQGASVPIFKQFQYKELPSEHTEMVSLLISNKSSNKLLYTNDVSSAINYAERSVKVTSGDNFKHVTDAIKEWELEGDEEEKKGEDGPVFKAFIDDLDSMSLQNIASKTGKKIKGGNFEKRAAGTMSVVLTQALQSNDHTLLETVLSRSNTNAIKDTIFRLKPVLAVVLLERLAEKIARQTHRQDQLSVWIKWCLIVHGGYLVTVPNLISSLSSLYSTLKRRSDLLPTFLGLQSRLLKTLNTLSVAEELLLDKQKDDEYLKQEEEYVEYNEELDDAGLIDDGEEDYEEYEDSNDEDDGSDDDAEENIEHSEKLTQEYLDASDKEEEGGYSDLETV
ncbi:hypothetical protein TBLA_0A02500 [Henningerozyma blattae CBS 6284]|uniref:Small-subunit processome Utp12 domain-containing protein n=1 Tax=Henningerozyma blattae (strain ATCC 34711 / CBS 6284 / DSM 70876 / NBRC 10599 / NRRL Y-10934 / UCD 77-7) TaxID=1071380 RepID=I2GV97_HENB6|nr:hypothetical protein TBLA_0A02500 [Tetrapisispora blattae CBS 6284]CCH58049.1 hypothetical protein TBLA_0A02500 [Tetrapisispora blattae CBS 6284]